jgi:hypothetical protein
VGLVDPSTPIWFTAPDLALSHEEPDQWGRNTVQKIADDNPNYLLVLHPQYFHSVDPDDEDYDDPNDATFVLTIEQLRVYDYDTGEYIECVIDAGIAKVPVAYARTNSDGDTYLRFNVVLEYTDLNTGDAERISWSDAYLNVSIFFTP